MKKTLLVLTLLFTGSLLYAAEPQFPALTGPVVDSVNLLSQEQVRLLSQKSLSFQSNKGSQIAVCIVPTTAPLTIEEYGIKLAEKWKIGRADADDGIIIIVAKDDRKMRIEAGYGLEHAVTDLRAGRIVDLIMAPEFRKGDFYRGIDSSIDSLIIYINGGDIPALSPEALSASGTSSDADETRYSFALAFVIGSIVIFIIFNSFGKYLLSMISTYILLFIGLYLLGTGLLSETAIITGLALIPYIIVALIMKYSPGGTSSGSSGYSSDYSSSSSDSCSSSSSSDSYSGGGGDFGGGGASGSW